MRRLPPLPMERQDRIGLYVCAILLALLMLHGCQTGWGPDEATEWQQEWAGGR